MKHLAQNLLPFQFVGFFFGEIKKELVWGWAESLSVLSDYSYEYGDDELKPPLITRNLRVLVTNSVQQMEVYWTPQKPPFFDSERGVKMLI